MVVWFVWGAELSLTPAMCSCWMRPRGRSRARRGRCCRCAEPRLAGPTHAWCLRHRNKTASTPDSSGFSILGTGLARVHDLLDEMAVRSADKSSGGKATTCLYKVAILFLCR
jgi:hypothetical protein